MESILTDIVDAIDIWLENLTVKEEKYNQVQNTQDRIQQTILQMRFEGEVSAEIQNIANLWIEILNLLSSDAYKEELVMKILLLFEIGGISRSLTYQFIVNLLN